MHFIKPQVFLVGETTVTEGMEDFLNTLPEWGSYSPSDAEFLTEVMGRICYRSFAPGLNPNVTKIREGNDKYLENILKSGHGSVLEHAVFSFIFKDVSRVFTHELVRHRAGTAVSQESLRYVRLTDLSCWYPPSVKEYPGATERLAESLKQAEEAEEMLGTYFGLDDPSATFFDKKQATSFMRRLIPMGVATTIGWSVNARELRWVIETRTTVHAEEEMRFVFDKVAEIVTKRYPHLFGDFSKDEQEQWVPKFSKV